MLPGLPAAWSDGDWTAIVAVFDYRAAAADVSGGSKCTGCTSCTCIDSEVMRSHPDKSYAAKKVRLSIDAGSMPF